MLAPDTLNIISTILAGNGTGFSLYENENDDI